jgi:hypothetical protein
MKRCYLGTAVVLALLLPACGSSTTTTSTPATTQPPAPLTTTIFNRPFSVAGAPQGHVIYGFQDVSVPNSGQVEASFDYTFASSDIEMVVTQTTCSDPASAYQASCTTLGSDKNAPKASKRADVVFQLSAAGSIRIWIFNFTPAQESGVLNVNLTH